MNLKATPEQLRAARMIRGQMRPNSEDAFSLCVAVEEITRTERNHVKNTALRAPTKKRLRTARQAIGAFLAELLLGSTQTASMGFSYCPSAHQHRKDSLLDDTTFRQIKDIWPKLGWLDIQTGFNDAFASGSERMSSRGFCARFRPTSKLIEFCRSFGICSNSIWDHFSPDRRSIPPIAVKKGKTRDQYGRVSRGSMPLPPSDKLDTETDRVESVNEFISAFDIAPFPTPTFTRIFNNGDQPNFDYDMGGRLYDRVPNSYQSQSSELRQTITIEGEATVEIDISASHFRIFSGLRGQPLEANIDPYCIDGLNRAVAKRTVNLMLTQQRPLERWPMGFRKEMAEAGIPLPKSMTASKASQIMIDAYPVLTEVSVANLDWSKLQHIESEILFSAMERLREASDTPALPVHDSLIVPASKAAIVEETLRDCFKARANAEPRLKRECS